MPPVNQAALSAGVIAVSVAVAAAIAVYESPELRRMADDLRRKIAIALHSLGDNIQPGPREPIFNRPEDADGFMHSRAEPGVDADEETKRRQREELMYWNSLHLQKKEQEDWHHGASRQEEPQQQTPPPVPSKPARGSTFDDFLQRDGSGDQGTYVFNTGADPRRDDEGLLRRRGPEGVRGLNSWLPANPFADENGIELDEQHPVMQPNIISPGRDEMSDIYSVTEPEPASPAKGNPAAAAAATRASSATVSPASADHNIASVLFDAASHIEQQSRSEGSRTLERELGPDEYMTAGQDDMNRDAYASIQAWAQNSQHSNMGFYSPLPVSPAAPLSEPELISEGALTPADSVSVISSGEDLGGNEAASARHEGESTVFYDVVSDEEDGDGIPTPVSWSEVGSVISESDTGPIHA